MGKNIDKKELVQLVAKKLSKDPEHVELVIDTAVEEMVEAFRCGEGVTIRNFGTFYIDWRRTGTVFKFNPSQRLRALFGWSSTYKGDV
jgi:DNA-binding protein HU-beta